jgi:Ni,Fe-hydrogenase III large subunit
LSAFVVPGLEIAQAHGLDLRAAGLEVVATPRHASVLVLVGELPAGLARSAAVVYAQMPRPRALLAAGASDIRWLPAPDVAVPAEQAALVSGVAALRERFRTGSFSPTAPEFEVAPLGTATEYARPMHSEVVRAEPGVGMDHGAHGMDHMQMGSGGGFMSMVMMTRDLPRSVDGLPMEWLEVPFGPLFTGLPGGLALSLTLDGDTVAKAKLEPGTLWRDLEATWRGPVEGFIERFARLDPLSPAAYRALAERALQAAGNPPVDHAGRRQWVGVLERERAASHLVWLASFGFLFGDRVLEQRAAALRRQLGQASDPIGLRRVREEARALVRQVDRTPLLARRLRGVGVLDRPKLAEFDGPVSRAAGAARDVRTEDPTYQELGFRPLALDGGDALARLRLRLGELEQSLDLLLASLADRPPSVVDPSRVGTGQASVETPRGAATLRIQLDGGYVTQAELWSPSQRLAELISPVSEGRELADALLGIASLDLSPWELGR